MKALIPASLIRVFKPLFPKSVQEKLKFEQVHTIPPSHSSVSFGAARG